VLLVSAEESGITPKQAALNLGLDPGSSTLNDAKRALVAKGLLVSEGKGQSVRWYHVDFKPFGAEK
jgi:hypothetical protein